MSLYSCAVCGHVLFGINEPCPICLPNWNGPPAPPLIPCPICGGEAVAHQDKLARARFDVPLDADISLKLARLEEFKRYVHAWLDRSGVPHEVPESPHTAKGCRIGGRLEYLEKAFEVLDQRWEKAEAALAAERKVADRWRWLRLFAFAGSDSYPTIETHAHVRNPRCVHLEKEALEAAIDDRLAEVAQIDEAHP
jgi:hypothetical protein